MVKNNEVTATMLIEPLSEPSLAEATKLLWKKVKGKQAPMFLYGGAFPVYQVGDDFNGYILLFNPDMQTVDYFVNYKKVHHGGISAGRQVLLWRAQSSPAAGGFAQHVFFKVLLPKYKTLFADTQQSDKGKEFWTNAIAHAFERNLHVYMYDRRKVPNELVEFDGLGDLNKHQDRIWGTELGHKRLFAVISLDKLSLRAKKEGIVQPG